MKVLLLSLAFGCALAQGPGAAVDIDEIMSRVAQNQAQSLDARKDWVYSQKQLLRMVRANGRLAREERREYAITPRRRRTEKHLVKFEGKYENHGKYIAYDRPGYEYKGIDIDGDVINDISEDMTNDKDSRDGIDHDLFPLTREEQKKYTFRLKGTETYRGRPVFRVSFEPTPHRTEGDAGSWKGDALIDPEEYEPVLVTTNLAFKIPMAVKILLGTNIKGLGFTVSYQKFAEGVWFPVSYGGEFEVRAAFFYRRNISVSMTNGDFRRTDVTTNIAYTIEDK